MEKSLGGCWAAPESLLSSNHQQIENSLLNLVDSFIIGLFYFYVLSRGDHPFDPVGKGEDEQICNIIDKNYQVYKDEWDGGSIWQGKTDGPEKVRAVIFFSFISKNAVAN